MILAGARWGQDVPNDFLFILFICCVTHLFGPRIFGDCGGRNVHLRPA
jgi:hypothetical protein